MSILDLIMTANRNLFRSKLRTTLTILAIFVGGFTLTLTTSLNTGAGQYLDRQLGNISEPGIFEVTPKTDLNPFGSSDVVEYDPENKQINAQSAFTTASMTQKDADKLAKVEGVESAIPYYTLTVDYLTREGSKKYNPPTLRQDLGLKLDLETGRLLLADDKNAIILPDSYLGPLNLSADEAINKEITVAYKNLKGESVDKKLKIVGIMRKTFLSTGQAFIDTSTAKEIYSDQDPSGKFLEVIVKFKDANETTDEAALGKRLEAAGSYTALSMKEQIGAVLSIVDAITTGLNVVGIIALFAASFGIINTLLMSVYERTQEIGLMKALGMSRSRVFSLFAIEAILVGFWGSAVAVGTAWLVSFLVNSWASSSFLKDFDGFVLLVVTPGGVIFVIALIMAVAFVAGALPALKASRLNPIEALRSE